MEITPKFNIGDTVWLNAFLSQITEVSEEDKEFLIVLLPLLYGTVDKIKVEIKTDNGTENTKVEYFYKIKSGILKYKNYDINNIAKFPFLFRASGLEFINEKNDIFFPENSLLSFEEGKQLLIERLENFKNVIENLNL